MYIVFKSVHIHFFSFCTWFFFVQYYIVYKYYIPERVIVRIITLRKWLSIILFEGWTFLLSPSLCTIYFIIPKLLSGRCGFLGETKCFAKTAQRKRKRFTKPHNRPCQFAKNSNCLKNIPLAVLNIFRLCTLMCDLLFQDKALNKLVLNGQKRAGSHFLLFFSMFRTFNWKIQQAHILPGNMSFSLLM